MTQPVTIQGWPKGVNNINAPEELSSDMLRSGVNVDIMDSGKARRRKGSTSVASALDTHSLWSHELLSEGYYVSGSSMYSLSSKGVSAAVVSGLTIGSVTAFEHVEGDVFWSNGHVSGRLRSGVNGSFGVETPSKQMDLAVGVGSLPAGRYQVTTTYRTASGEEGGTPKIDSIVLPTTGGIVISNMPAPESADVASRCIYVTEQNGDTLYRSATLPVATTSHTISETGSSTTVLRTRETQQMPPGTLLAHRFGVMYVASGNVIYHSEHMRLGQCNISKNFYMFSAPVTVMLAAPEGLYVCADKTYLIESPATADVVLRTLFPFGGVVGTGVHLPNNTGVSWFSKKGHVVAFRGEVTIPSEKTYVPGAVTRGSSLIREQNGIRQIITVAHESESNPLEYI